MLDYNDKYIERYLIEANLCAATLDISIYTVLARYDEFLPLSGFYIDVKLHFKVLAQMVLDGSIKP